MTPLPTLEEHWLPVVGFEHGYEVSDLGRVQSIPGGHRHGKVLKLSIDRAGYPRVCMTKDGKHYFRYVHRLVAQAFLENSENKPMVNHKDGVKTNDRLENLEWSTASENMQHSYDVLKRSYVLKPNHKKRAITTNRNVLERTHCRNGHRYVEGSYYWKQGQYTKGRICMECKRISWKKKRERKQLQQLIEVKEDESV